MKNIIVILVFLLGFAANAQEKKDKNAKYSVEVNGNCEMCKKRIEAAAYQTKGVKSANWDVATHQLDLIINEQKSSIGEVEKSVAKTGHDTQHVKATQADYEQLHGCCLYERE